MEKLGGTMRRLIDLRYHAGLWVPQIATAIGKSVQATYALLKRARQSLRECAERRLQEGSS
jgi:DNA-directed RNA polymerase specialized sigma24 family protein